MRLLSMSVGLSDVTSDARKPAPYATLNAAWPEASALHSRQASRWASSELNACSRPLDEFGVQ